MKEQEDEKLESEDTRVREHMRAGAKAQRADTGLANRYQADMYSTYQNKSVHIQVCMCVCVSFRCVPAER